MERDATNADVREPAKRWEKPVVSDVSLESDEDVLGSCFSSSQPGQSDPCGPLSGNCPTA